MLYCSLKVHTVALVLPPNDIEVKYIHKYSYSTCSKVMVGGVFYGCVLWVSDMYLAKNPTQYNKTYQCKAHTRRIVNNTKYLQCKCASDLVLLMKMYNNKF